MSFYVPSIDFDDLLYIQKLMPMEFGCYSKFGWSKIYILLILLLLVGTIFTNENSVILVMFNITCLDIEMASFFLQWIQNKHNDIAKLQAMSSWEKKDKIIAINLLDEIKEETYCT